MHKMTHVVAENDLPLCRSDSLITDGWDSGYDLLGSGFVLYKGTHKLKEWAMIDIGIINYPEITFNDYHVCKNCIQVIKTKYIKVDITAL